ncbi:gluconokinase, GntK/IdnK-type [Cellulomonas soli]|uniref:gluconokinase n=1 Tax=Cellulomonas soli TaxID=931535 RepID=A0A512P891_9CELL|nr:carbohydrate kinase (thermoresistant glucokinase family) [Cellulomonas soli]GEP67421.1 hypothetical protein CSO01_01360 [Cellulomonas soli]
MSETRPASRTRSDRGPVRAWTLLLAVVVPTAVAAVVGMLLTWPGEATGADRPQLVDVAVELDSARVTATQLQRCDGTVEDVQADGTVPDQVDCLQVTARVTSGPRAGTTVEVFATAGLGVDDVPVGTAVVVEYYPEADGSPAVWAWHGFSRSLPLGAFALAFALVTVLVAGARGLRALIGLVLAFGVLALYVLPGLVAGENAVVLALCGSAVIVLVVLYLTHGVSLRTTTALVGTLVGLLMVAALGALGAHVARLDPVTTEDAYRLSQLLGSDGPQILRGVFLCGVVLAGLGVLNDVTITQASAVWELRAADPSAGWRRLFTQGMSIGRDHIASTVYTIAFAYAGASLPVLLLLEVYGQPLGQTLTSGPFAEEIVRTLAGSMGLVLAIPLTTVVAALVAVTASGEQARVDADTERVHAHTHAAGIGARAVPRPGAAPRVVVMGVSGCGKSTVGALLAERLGVPFLDADDLHPRSNVDKMAAGVPLTDEDRLPWLRLVGEALAEAPAGAVVACSALRRGYRDVLREAAPEVRFVHLAGTREQLAARLTSRVDHFMPAALLDSQLATLEPLTPDEDPVLLDIALAPAELAEQAARAL